MLINYFQSLARRCRYANGMVEPPWSLAKKKFTLDCSEEIAVSKYRTRIGAQ